MTSHLAMNEVTQRTQYAFTIPYSDPIRTYHHKKRVRQTCLAETGGLLFRLISALYRIQPGRQPFPDD